MNVDQTTKWLKVTFFVSISVFFLASVKALDSNIAAYGFLRILTDSPNLYQIINAVQYLNIVVFLVTVIMILRQKQNLQTVILFSIWGFFTLFTTWILATFKETIDVDIPATGVPSVSVLDRLTVYVTALSGLVAAVAGLYNQILAGRKALAEVEVEKLRLQADQAKAKAKPAKRKTAKARK